MQASNFCSALTVLYCTLFGQLFFGQLLLSKKTINQAMGSVSRAPPLCLPDLSVDLLALVVAALLDGDELAVALSCRKLHDAVAQARLCVGRVGIRTTFESVMHTRSRLTWAISCGMPLTPRLTARVARRGQLLQLGWLRASGCPWSVCTCREAARGGHLAVLQWARAHGCPWDSWTASIAARGGHLEMLQWARAHGCTWDAVTCSKAAAGGHLEVLQWLRANGCPWDERTPREAAHGGHLHVLHWVTKEGCPLNHGEVMLRLYAAQYVQTITLSEILDWQSTFLERN